MEALLRRIIEPYAAQRLGLPRESEWRQHIYSSHYHTSDEPEPAWRKRWTEFRRNHPDVDTRAKSGQSCRADLFIHTADVGLVSVEFQYVPPNRTPPIAVCVREVAQHLSRHTATVLVVYAAVDVSARFGRTIETVRQRLNSLRAVVVSLVGPPVAFP